jgi:hypothetical protein
VVNGEQRQLQPVRHTDLVVNVAQIILDHLLGRAQLGRDFLVLVALHNQRHNAQFLGRQPVADAQPDHIVLGQLARHRHVLHPAFAARDLADTVHQRRAGDVPINHAMRSRRHVALRALARVGEHDHASFVLVGSREDGVEVGVETSGNDQHCGAKLVERHEHLLGSLRLGHNAHLVFNGQHFGDASSENRLIIGQNKL